eukprot:6442475-Amphidinium_carterae.1
MARQSFIASVFSVYIVEIPNDSFKDSAVQTMSLAQFVDHPDRPSASRWSKEQPQQQIKIQDQELQCDIS